MKFFILGDISADEMFKNFDKVEGSKGEQVHSTSFLIFLEFSGRGGKRKEDISEEDEEGEEMNIVEEEEEEKATKKKSGRKTLKKYKITSGNFSNLY